MLSADPRLRFTLRIERTCGAVSRAPAYASPTDYSSFCAVCAVLRDVRRPESMLQRHKATQPSDPPRRRNHTTSSACSASRVRCTLSSTPTARPTRTNRACGGATFRDWRADGREPGGPAAARAAHQRSIALQHVKLLDGFKLGLQFPPVLPRLRRPTGQGAAEDVQGRGRHRAVAAAVGVAGATW